MAREITVETMWNYVEKTEMVGQDRYSVGYREMQRAYELAQRSPFNAMMLMFNYGFAKGQRALKAHQRHQRKETA